MTDEEYFKLPYCSNSGMKDAKSLYLKGESAFGDSKAFLFGSAYDSLITNVQEFSTEGLTEDEIKSLIPMRRTLNKCDTYKTLFRGRNCRSQLVCIDKEKEFEIDGMNVKIPSKCKFDAFNDMLNIGADLKTTVAKKQLDFVNAAKFFGYDMQGAWYMDLAGIDRFIIFGISKVNYKMFIHSIKRGDEEYESGKKKYMDHIKYWWKLHQYQLRKE